MSGPQEKKEDKVPNEPPPAMPPLKPVSTTNMPLHELVDHLEELVMFALECEKKEIQEKVSFVDVYKKLMVIKQSIDLLSKDQQEAVNVMENLSKYGTVPKEDKELAPEDKKLIDKLDHLQSICVSAKERLYETLQKAPEVEEDLKAKIKEATGSEERKSKRRQAKFRRVGGKEGWIPT
jgi:hypothetical protein